MNSRHKAALRIERLQTYRGVGSYTMIAGAIVALAFCLSLEGIWRLVGVAVSFVAIFIGYPIGELLGMLVARRGLRPEEVDVLHALRFLEFDPHGASLCVLEEDNPDLTRSWVLSLAGDEPEDVIVRRTRVGAKLLDAQG